MFLSWWEVQKNEILCFRVGGRYRKTKYYVSELVGGPESDKLFLNYMNRHSEYGLSRIKWKITKTK